MRELMTKRARRSFSFLPASASLLMLLLGLERAGFSEEVDDRICEHRKECVAQLELANQAKILADNKFDDNDRKAKLYKASAIFYYRAYEYSSNPDLLISSCYMKDMSDSNACASKGCYMSLISKHSSSDVVIERRGYIDKKLVNCIEEEAKSNAPQVQWDGSFKPGFSSPIYLKDGEKPWQEYVTQVEAENTDRLKKKFPHHYRTEIAGKTFLGLGLAGAIGGGVAALMGLPICFDGCRINSPELTLSNNLIDIGGPIAAGSFGLGLAGIIIMISPSFSKRYSEYAKFPVPSYRHMGDASVPE